MTASATLAATEPDAATARRVLITGLAGAFTTLTDTAVLTVAGPSLRASLHAGPGEVQWIFAAYSLTFALALVPAGRLGDAYGRRNLFLAGICVFSAGALVSATATAPWVLVLGRLVQGLGGGTVNPQTLGLFQDHFAGHARARALGAYAATGGVAAAIGPGLGAGIILALGPDLGWRVAILGAVPSGLFALLAALRFLPPGTATARGGSLSDRIDVVGLGLVGTATVLAVLVVTPTGLPVPPVVPGGAVVAVLVVLIAYERGLASRGGVPILHPALVRSPRYVLGTAVAMLHFGVAVSGSVLLSLLVQVGSGATAFTVALVTLPSAIGMSIGSACAWRALRRGRRHAVTLALALWTAALLGDLAVVRWAAPDRWALLLAATHLVAAVFAGFVVSPNQALTLAAAPPGTAGLAAGILQVAQRISSAICLSAFTGMFLAAGPDRGADAARAGYLAVGRLAVGLGLVAVLLSALDGVRSRRM